MKGDELEGSKGLLMGYTDKAARASAPKAGLTLHILLSALGNSILQQTAWTTVDKHKDGSWSLVRTSSVADHKRSLRRRMGFPLFTFQAKSFAIYSDLVTWPKLKTYTDAKLTWRSGALHPLCFATVLLVDRWGILTSNSCILSYLGPCNKSYNGDGPS